MTIGFTLGEIAQWVGAEVRGDPAYVVSGMATLSAAQSHQLAFLSNTKYTSQLASTQAGAVLIRAEEAPLFSGHALILENPYAAFALLSHRFDRTPKPAPGVHPSAVVAPTARLGERVCIGPHVVIGEHVVIGAGSSIDAGCVIHARAQLGEQCRLYSRVVVYHDCVLGNQVVLHSGVIIGADGFGYAPQGGRWHKIAQIGIARLGNRVEVGANTTIDRGALGDTIIHDGVIIDNQVQIAHNVQIGANTAIAACTGIAGSTTIGANCILAGGVGIVGHIDICDGVQITAMTLITKSISAPGSYSSGTAFERSEVWKKMAVRLKKLDELVRRVGLLESSAQRGHRSKLENAE